MQIQTALLPCPTQWNARYEAAKCTKCHSLWGSALRNLVGISVIGTINNTFWFKGTQGWNRGNNLGHFSPRLFRNTFCGKGVGAREREAKKEAETEKQAFGMALPKGKNSVKLI